MLIPKTVYAKCVYIYTHTIRGSYIIQITVDRKHKA